MAGRRSVRFLLFLGLGIGRPGGLGGSRAFGFGLQLVELLAEVAGGFLQIENFLA